MSSQSVVRMPMERWPPGSPSSLASPSLTLAMVWVASTLTGISSSIMVPPPYSFKSMPEARFSSMV